MADRSKLSAIGGAWQSLKNHFSLGFVEGLPT
jgi:hypothetical protein